MTCLNPKAVKFEWYTKINEETGEIYQTKRAKFKDFDYLDETNDYIPCGKCEGCMIDKANDWATRAYLEAQNWHYNAFLTLTYNNESLPTKKSLQKADLQKFWKRLRKAIYPNKISYMACGEYGGTTQRPHYHAAVFNYWPSDTIPYKKNKTGDMLYTSKTLSKIWGKGYVIIGQLTYQSAAYIARYCVKKAYGITKKFYKNKENEFITSSKNPAIAKNWFFDTEKWIYLKRNNGVLVHTNNGVQIKPIPQYLKQKWKENNREEYFKQQEEEKIKNIEIQKSILKNTSLNFIKYQKQKSDNKKEKLKRLDKVRTNNLNNL